MCDLVKQSVEVVHFTADKLFTWSDHLRPHFHRVPGLTSFRAFLFSTTVPNQVKMSMRCDEQNSQHMAISKGSDITPIGCAHNYRAQCRMKKLTVEKLNDLKKCYQHLLHNPGATSYLQTLLNENDTMNNSSSIVDPGIGYISDVAN